LGLVSDRSETERRNAVVATALVIDGWVWSLVGFFDQAGREHPLQAAVEGTGAEVEGVAGLYYNFVHDRVAVALLVGKGQEDVKDGWSQWRWVFMRHYHRPRYIRCGYSNLPVRSMSMALPQKAFDRLLRSS
jgi:hypothetical protein